MALPLEKRREKFIIKSKEIHLKKGIEFNYSNVKYVDGKTKVEIICKEHGPFFQRPINHLDGKGCPDCGKKFLGKGKLMSQETFLEKCNKIHNNFYDYSQAFYVNGRSNITIICPIDGHGQFDQKAASHKEGHGCPECAKIIASNSTRLTIDIFKDRANVIHNNFYDYSIANYIDNNTKLKIICPKHNSVFEQRPSNHLVGQGCPQCGRESHIKLMTYTNEEFIEKVKAIHGDAYDYTRVKYIHNKLPVELECKKEGHGIFSIRAGNLFEGHGCQKCGLEILSKKLTKTQEEFLRQAIEVHGDKYDYSKSVYNKNNEKIIIICKKHNKEFLQVPHGHLDGKGCQECGTDRMAKSNILTNEEFIEKSRLAHGDRYIYSGSSYEKSSNKVRVDCKIHGPFYQMASSHMNGRGCPACFATTMFIHNFVELCQEKYKHLDYDYSNTVYTGAHCKIIIGCKKEGHGNFIKLADKFYHGGYVCPKCTPKKNSKPESLWLDYIGIHPSCRNNRVVIGDRFFYLDGIDYDKNIIYEFYGDFYHGNPKYFDPDKINKVTGKTFGEMYKNTLEKEKYITENSNFTFITIWERDFSEKVRSGEIIIPKYN